MGLDLTQFRTPTSYDPTEPVVPLPTGSVLFDYVTGIGGLPRGRIVEAFGRESSGKSTAFYQAIAQCQAAGGVGLVLDYENAFTGLYASSLGLDLSPAALLVEPPPLTIEKGFTLARQITQAALTFGVPAVVMFDSVAAMPLESEEDGAQVDNNTLGMQRAKAINDHLRTCAGLVARSGAVWAFVNHELDDIVTDMFAPGARARVGQKRTPGGRSLKFYAAQRYQFTPGRKLKGKVVNPVTGEESEGFVAVKSKIVAVKNKLAAPYREAEVLIRYGAGIDNAFSLLEVGIARGLIQRPTTQRFTFSDGQEVIGADAAVAYIRETPSMYAHLNSTVRELIEASWEHEQQRLFNAVAQAATENEEG